MIKISFAQTLTNKAVYGKHSHHFFRSHFENSFLP
jgi:hypothetical protein